VGLAEVALVTKFLRLSPRGAFGRFPLWRREDTQGVVVSASTFGPNFQQQCAPRTHPD
jgi:hypothetical protein